MIIVETGKFSAFESYLHSLSKSAKKNWQYAKKHNANVIYQRTEFNQETVQAWMDTWGRQLIRGQHRTFAFSADALIGKDIVCFEGIENGRTIAYQFVELQNGYMNCHPVMYEKEKYSHRYLSKWMWFNLLSWAIENKVLIVDLGGGNDNDWREMIKTRNQYPNPAYKWMYVPQRVKENPEAQENYRVTHEGITKRISKIN